MPAIKTRPPTGRVPWPLLLLAGEEKAGKSFNAALFTRSTRIGRKFWLDLGEGSADEYAVIPGADYEVIVHNGTHTQILEQVEAVFEEAVRAARAGEPPVLLIVDSMGAYWKMLSQWATGRAARNKKNAALLERDPDAEVDVPTVYWNEANARHRRVVDLLMQMPAIVVVTARLKEVSVMKDGAPTGEKVWKAEAQKDLAYDATMIVHLYRTPRRAEVVGVRSINVKMPDGRPVSIPVTEEKGIDLEHLVFDVLGCSVEQSSAGRQMPRLTESLAEGFAEEISHAETEEALSALWAKIKAAMPPTHERQALSQAITARLTRLREASQAATAPPAIEAAPHAEPTARERLQAAAAARGMIPASALPAATRPAPERAAPPVTSPAPAPAAPAPAPAPAGAAAAPEPTPAAPEPIEQPLAPDDGDRQYGEDVPSWAWSL